MHVSASAGCGQTGQPEIVGSEGRGMCGADGERPEESVPDPADKMDWRGRQGKGCAGKMSAGSGRIRKGFEGWREKKRALGWL